MARKRTPEPENRPAPRRPGRPRTRTPRQGPGPIPLASKADRENMASWVESFVAWMHGALAKEAGKLAQDPGNSEARGKVTYYRNAIGLSRQMAYYLRTGRRMQEKAE